MVSSACEILSKEPTRFLGYIFSDPRVRKKIVDKKSFANALEQVLNSDSSLKNIVTEIKKHGEDIEMCGEDIFDMPDIQELIKRNRRNKLYSIRRLVKKQHPKWDRKALSKEAQRRLKISITASSRAVRQLKQVTITDATHPVKVKGYKRGAQTIHSHRKMKYRRLTAQEKMLIENAIIKGKTPSQIRKDFISSGLPYRSNVSIKRHYQRIKNKIT